MKWRLALLVYVLLAGISLARAATREVYVWQRQFDAEVATSLRAFAPQIDQACVLAAEIGWRNGRADVVRPSVDFAALAKCGRPAGLALRIGTVPASHSPSIVAQEVIAVARERIAAARSDGLTPAEIQIDYDCAESKLADYRAWLHEVRAALAPAPLAFTALPVWLKHPEFAALAREADGFVLQVHSLERPKDPDAAFALCDPVRAMAWARQANELGGPFRVALPTYGYVLAFDPAGKLLGLAAEGRRPDWPANARLRAVRADAVAMARLAGELEGAQLPSCRGVIWFRLPVQRDRMNWHASTFAAVLRGETPRRVLAAQIEWVQPGLAEIVIANDGQTTEPPPAEVRLRWPAEARVLAADALRGFRLEIRGGEAQGIVRAADVTADASVAPGGKARIAWLRFAHDVSLEVSLPAAP